MQERRFFLKGMTGLGVVVAIAATGCGFKLREAPKFHFQKLWLGGATQITDYVRKYLYEMKSDVEIVSNIEDAQAWLIVDSEIASEVIVGQTATGQVREKQLRMTVAFRMWMQGKESEAAQDVIEQFRESSYSETQALAKEEEESLLYADMRKSIAQQLVWRLSALQP